MNSGLHTHNCEPPYAPRCICTTSSFSIIKGLGGGGGRLGWDRGRHRLFNMATSLHTCRSDFQLPNVYFAFLKENPCGDKRRVGSPCTFPSILL